MDNEKQIVFNFKNLSKYQPAEDRMIICVWNIDGKNKGAQSMYSPMSLNYSNKEHIYWDYFDFE